MTPLDARVAQLIAELERDWKHAKTNLTRATSVEPAASPAAAALVALALDHAYQAFETFLVRVERALGLPERAGQHWHTQLLADAAVELAGIRPPAYPSEARRDWEVLLRFRHFLRHAYAVELDAGELEKNREHLKKAVAATDPHVASLISELSAGIGKPDG